MTLKVQINQMLYICASNILITSIHLELLLICVNFISYPSTEEISAKQENELIDSNHQTLNNANIAIKTVHICIIIIVLYVQSAKIEQTQKATTVIM